MRAAASNLMASRSAAAVLLLAIVVAPDSHAQTTADPAARLEALVAAAENNLRDHELQIAESLYRSALMSGWMLIGTLRADEHRLADARDAFLHASTSAVDAK